MMSFLSMKMPLGRPTCFHEARSFSILIEHLHSGVRPVTDKQPAARIQCQCTRAFELVRTRTVPAPLLDVLASLVELDDARVGRWAVTIRHEDVAVWRDQHIGRVVDGVAAVAGRAQVAK